MVEPAPHQAAHRPLSVKNRNTVSQDARITTVRSSRCGNVVISPHAFFFVVFLDLRRCGRCTKLALYCVNAGQAAEHRSNGGVVVYDPFASRTRL